MNAYDCMEDYEKKLLEINEENRELKIVVAEKLEVIDACNKAICIMQRKIAVLNGQLKMYQDAEKERHFNADDLNELNAAQIDGELNQWDRMHGMGH